VGDEACCCVADSQFRQHCRLAASSGRSVRVQNTGVRRSGRDAIDPQRDDVHARCCEPLVEGHALDELRKDHIAVRSREAGGDDRRDSRPMLLRRAAGSPRLLDMAQNPLQAAATGTSAGTDAHGGYRSVRMLAVQCVLQRRLTAGRFPSGTCKPASQHHSVIQCIQIYALYLRRAAAVTDCQFANLSLLQVEAGAGARHRRCQRAWL
jgi:hypothetical protein